MSVHAPHSLNLPDGRVLSLGPTPLIMGILNVTPDSFSDGGDFDAQDPALQQAEQMWREGADILDIGGESTRPGSEPLGAQDELDRVMPVLDALAAADYPLPISIDTYKAIVAHQALEAGVQIINDVWGFQKDPEIADVAAHSGAPAILMHWDPERDRSKDIIGEMRRFFDISLDIAEQAGVDDRQVVLDPGFGFAKDLAENHEILRRLDEICAWGYPVLAGTSRKSMIGKVLDVPPKDRLYGTIATNIFAYRSGAHIFRVHDVAPHVHALRIAETTMYGPVENS